MTEPDTRELLARQLTEARERTLRLTDLDEPELLRQHDPLMSPLVWDLAHIGQQEDLWLLRRGEPARPGLLPPDVEQLYDAFTHPRAVRARLPLLPPVEARAFCADVRGRVLDRLDTLDPAAGDDPFDFAMVAGHEQQHDETMLQAVQLRSGPPVLGTGAPLPPGRPGVAGTSVLVPAGGFVLGVDAADEPFSLDNERPAHVVHVDAFRIGRVPVTNAEYAAFLADGGYDQPRWWSTRGWQHRCDAGLERPMSWLPDGSRVRFGVREDVPGDEPVQHVTFFEAEAYAAWYGQQQPGARLPTEVEWEKAAAWDPGTGRRRRWPWGSTEPTPALANLDGAALRPAPVGAYPAGASAYGVEQLIGDVWEWTSSEFTAWPGFTPMLYADYSAPFFGGDHRVLRGPSWAVGSALARPSFRNWDRPMRRQVFSGLRLAWSA
ncbi:ergothioneine biosynthesis protein EgtB [Modestobacter sp. I12A-02628]|uniref:Hercynine oxygenase n=1 Tax=Goekera deserti TaxID=2497753 RepID=A0A7K3WHQ6_9ACTN|nr:ergothioneine biosynthesis protein EgtB [Goekera deserti]MPQ97748.1 ergothioneine biosynthesis protein EgtB [Goekera deserti]NDI48393.1 ergothioneine biosynthesis protein EgtB [Goekera deserti]NEL55994.1 ergothioneine biosynthesis protein EgtB [Goekera deserti]